METREYLNKIGCVMTKQVNLTGFTDQLPYNHSLSMTQDQKWKAQYEQVMVSVRTLGTVKFG